MAAGCATEAFSTTCAVHIEDCEGTEYVKLKVMEPNKGHPLNRNAVLFIIGIIWSPWLCGGECLGTVHVNAKCFEFTIIIIIHCVFWLLL